MQEGSQARNHARSEAQHDPRVPEAQDAVNKFDMSTVLDIIAYGRCQLPGTACLFYTCLLYYFEREQKICALDAVRQVTIRPLR